VSWRLVFTRQAVKDSKMVASAGFKPQAQHLLDIQKDNPYQTPPVFEKLLGNLDGACSRRINIHHRLVYQILPVMPLLFQDLNPSEGYMSLLRQFTLGQLPLFPNFRPGLHKK